MKSVCRVLCAALVLAFSANFALATSLQLPGYTNTFVGVVPDSSNGFGDIATAGDGSIYSTGDFGSDLGEIYKKTPSGSFVKIADVGNETLVGLGLVGTKLFASTSSGNIYVTDLSSNVTSLFASPGGSVNDVHIVAGLSGASFTVLAANQEGNAFWYNGDTGALQNTIGGLGSTSALAVSPLGDLYGVSSSGVLNEFNTIGVISSTGGFGQSDGLAIHPLTGQIYLADPGTQRKLQLDPNTLASTIFATGVVFDGGYFQSPLEFSVDGSSLFYMERIGDASHVSVINGFESASAVPLPGALPLFGGGLGLMSLFGWWRRRIETA